MSRRGAAQDWMPGAVCNWTMGADAEVPGLLCGAIARWHVIWRNPKGELIGAGLCEDHVIEAHRRKTQVFEFIHHFVYPCTHPKAVLRSQTDPNGDQHSWCQIPDEPLEQTEYAHEQMPVGTSA